MRLQHLLLASAPIAAALVFAPVEVTSSGTVQENVACAQIDKPPATGTCCPDPEGICVIGTYAFRGYYYKSEGRCSAG